MPLTCRPTASLLCVQPAAQALGVDKKTVSMVQQADGAVNNPNAFKNAAVAKGLNEATGGHGAAARVVIKAATTH